MSTRTSAARVVRAPRGTKLTCKAWPQEAAYRMIQNNLDPEVAERPEDLVVYGGTGKAARTWTDVDRILTALQRLESDETFTLDQCPFPFIRVLPGSTDSVTPSKDGNALPLKRE